MNIPSTGHGGCARPARPTTPEHGADHPAPPIAAAHPRARRRARGARPPPREAARRAREPARRARARRGLPRAHRRGPRAPPGAEPAPPAGAPRAALRGPAIRSAAVRVLLEHPDRPEALHYREWF